MLYDFIVTQREELIKRAREKVALRAVPRATAYELAYGVPLFLSQLGDILRQEANHTSPDDLSLRTGATQHGGEMHLRGFTVAQVVQDYGDICQAITELAIESKIDIPASEFGTLNRLLDIAIANAVTEYGRRCDVGFSGDEIRRRGFLAHELRNHLNTAFLACQVVRAGKVGTSGSTMEVLERSLHGLRALIDRSLSEVRLAAGIHQRERVRVAELIEQMEIDASIDASNRVIQFSVEPVDEELVIDVDRQLFASALSNLIHNAFKFSRPAGHVRLRAHSTPTHVSIEVEDECGGLAPGVLEDLFRPFEQRGADRAGLGLGLAIARRAIEVDGGQISVRDLPGQGCVFTVEMPMAVVEPGGLGTVRLGALP